MRMVVAQPKKPRCMFLYALAPEGLHPAKANLAINTLIGRNDIPLCVYHDHFIGPPGGIAIFDIKALSDVDRLQAATEIELANWRIELRPLIFSHNPAAFDEQIAYTLKAYGGADWEQVKQEKRPAYGNLGLEADTADDDLPAG